MKDIIETIKDLTTVSLVTYSNKFGEIALGYNHTLGIYNGQECTLKEAEFWLYSDIAALQRVITGTIGTVLNQHQERAVISLVHDIGIETFNKSKLRQYLINKQWGLASSCFLTYNTNGRAVSVAVLRRRQIEQNIFNLQVQ
jgi:GH24 family phage-related lysozyme (muramidase)